MEYQSCMKTIEKLTDRQENRREAVSSNNEKNATDKKTERKEDG